MVALAVVIVCALLNIAGVDVVSHYFAVAVLRALGAFRRSSCCSLRSSTERCFMRVTTPTTSKVDIIGGLLIGMWNYMGWDNASTIAHEVERPQRTYPRAMLAAVVIVALSYIFPVAAVWMTGLPPGAWETVVGDIAGMLGGPLLRIAWSSAECSAPSACSTRW